MERPYTGLTAEIKIDSTPLAYMSGVDLTLEKSIIEILQFGATWTEKVPAIKDWSATVDGTVAFAPGGSQEKLYQAYENGEELTIGIYLNDFTYFEGKAYVSGLNINGAPDDKMNISCDLEGNGALTFTLPISYAIKTSSGVGGTCSPGGTTRVASGGSFVLDITPAPGYTVNALMDNGVAKTSSISQNKYTVSNIVADHVINVTFKQGT